MTFDLSQSSKISIFKEIILENKELGSSFSASYLKRSIQIPEVPNKAMVFTGVRRSGKSTLMRQVQEVLAKESSRPFHALHIHFFDERLSSLQALELNQCIEAFYEIHPEISPAEPLYLFFDEIEMISGWELFVERQLRNPHRKVFITGSSSRLLSQEIATSMRGRSLSFEIFPFSFKEVLEWEKYSKAETRIQQAKTRARFDQYLFEGGFPEVIHQNILTQKKILQEYFEVLLLRDILERNQEGNIPLVRAFLKLLLQNFSSQITINKCHERLKSLGFKTDKTKLTEILKWVEDCYLFFSVSLFTESFSKQNSNPRKIYAIDNGMIKALATQSSENIGRLLENAVFIYFRSQGKAIHYYKTKSGYEIDFVVDGKDLYQVVDTIGNSETYEREVRALSEGMGELGIKNSYLVTRDPLSLESSHEIETKMGVVKVLNAAQLFSSN